MPETNECVEEMLVLGMLVQLDGVISDGCMRLGCHRRAVTLFAVAGITDEHDSEITFHRVYGGACGCHKPSMLDWPDMVEPFKPEGTDVIGTSVIIMPVAAWKELSAEVEHVH